ncbi:SOS response-associated peptidase [Corynebacterium sp.]|uniref:SOS response-associated peptidase n=1 Tax=Corynebacterium sp. TaxID=1720 RepID=UPI0025C707C6|nr:SOS response-associated peptidase [Corynebacterium sp.]
MCGRYVMFSTTETVLAAVSRLVGERVGVAGRLPRPSWNIAPTHTVPVLRRFAGAVTLGPAEWGYPAPWRPGTVLFNARGETVFDKASFRGSAPCLFVMDGWYEWKDRQPHYVDAPSGPLVAAGLCRPSDGDGGARLTATMVTTASAGPVDWLHDRMPLLLGAGGTGGTGAAGGEEALAWLDGSDDDRRALAASVPGDRVLGVLRTREADRRVGSVAVNGPELTGAGGADREGTAHTQD